MPTTRTLPTNRPISPGSGPRDVGVRPGSCHGPFPHSHTPGGHRERLVVRLRLRDRSPCLRASVVEAAISGTTPTPNVTRTRCRGRPREGRSGNRPPYPTGAQASRATIAADLPSLRAVATGSVQSSAAVAASLPAFVVEALAATGHPATIAATLPSWDADVTGYADMDAAIAGSLPSLTAAIMAQQISYTGQHYCPLSYSR